MSTMLDRTHAAALTFTVEDVQQFLYREARFLDDKDWESWLELYATGRGVLDAVLGR
jgi:hypothetical protein